MGRVVQVPERAQRIISLVPSQTELLYDLGLGERVVGITKFCVHPETWFKTKHRVGGTKKVDMDKVRALKPDLIIGNKEENERRDIQALEQEFPVWMSDVRDLPGALDMIARVGVLTGTQRQAADIVTRIEQGFADLRPLDPPRTEKHFAELNMICPGTPIRVVDGELFSWYGSRLLRSPAYFNGLVG
ncbi:MAG: ABC transporter substrate-binding protein [Flavobacteriales bacterium]|nr:ABC transporter substrate-binding protein [Flavobacteriales bacterium]